MKSVIQRVSSAQVTVDGKIIGKIQKGFLVLLGVMEGDTRQEAELLAEKIFRLRIFTDENDKMNLALADVAGAVLVISNFTLGADCSHGRRPNFLKAAKPAIAEDLYQQFIQLLREKGVPVETGIFGADMQVSLVNDGPVTILLDTAELQ